MRSASMHRIKRARASKSMQTTCVTCWRTLSRIRISRAIFYRVSNASAGDCPSDNLVVLPMRQFLAKFMLSLLVAATLVGCGVPGIPKPPSLDLPQPVADLRAVRKGDRVYLDWTVPSETTDRLAVRHLGLTNICRGLAPISECAN